MKTYRLSTLIVIFVLLCTNAIHAQTTQTQLNQLELIKQFIGNWKAEMGKDTTVFYEAKLFGTGIEDYMEFITKGKSYLKIKGLLGYDKKNDKYIHLKLLDPSGLALNAFWVTSKNIIEGVQYQYISNPEDAPLKWKLEFKSSDSLIMNTTLNSKVVSTLTFNREKK